MTLRPLRNIPWRLVGVATTWHLTSQQHAVRNASAASATLARRRRELLDVEDFLAAHAARHVA